MKISNERYSGLISFIWGLGEATFFFLVPDIWLSFVSRHSSLRKIIFHIVMVTAGALCGGLLMYFLGMTFPEFMWKFLDFIPAVNQGLLNVVKEQTELNQFGALFVGPIKGIPYKIYAVNYGIIKADVILFALVTIPARGIRFILTSLIARSICRMLHEHFKGSIPYTGYLILLFWVTFYIFYFYYMKF